MGCLAEEADAEGADAEKVTGRARRGQSLVSRPSPRPFFQYRELVLSSIRLCNRSTRGDKETGDATRGVLGAAAARDGDDNGLALAPACFAAAAIATTAAVAVLVAAKTRATPIERRGLTAAASLAAVGTFACTAVRQADRRTGRVSPAASLYVSCAFACARGVPPAAVAAEVVVVVMAAAAAAVDATASATLSDRRDIGEADN